MFISGVSRNLRIEMFSILTKSPGSKSNGTQDKNPTLPDKSDILPLKISKLPVPSFFTIISGFIEIIRPTVLPNPSFLINSEISKGSLIDGIILESQGYKNQPGGKTHDDGKFAFLDTNDREGPILEIAQLSEAGLGFFDIMLEASKNWDKKTAVMNLGEVRL